MELAREFDNVDILPIGEDVRHLDEPSKNIINIITAVYLRDSLVNDNSRCLILEKSEYQSRINDMLAIKYAMLFAEQEHK